MNSLAISAIWSGPDTKAELQRDREREERRRKRTYGVGVKGCWEILVETFWGELFSSASTPKYEVMTGMNKEGPRGGEG